MSDVPTGAPMDRVHQADAPGRYEIRVKGSLAARWTAWFDGMTLSPQGDGTTVLHGPVADQAALHGLLRKVSDLGLPLVSVALTAADGPPAAGAADGPPAAGATGPADRSRLTDRPSDQLPRRSTT